MSTLRDIATAKLAARFDADLLAEYTRGVDRAVRENRSRVTRERARDRTIRNLATKAEAEGRRR